MEGFLMVSVEYANHEKPNPIFPDLLDIQVRRLRKRKPQIINLIHVGGFDGSWDVGFFKRHRPLHVHSFEPYLRSYRKLKARFEEVGTANAYHAAIHPTLKRVSLFVPSVVGKKLHQGISSYASFSEGKTEQTKKQIEVKALSLDWFAKKIQAKSFDVLRINCEGGEFGIFESFEKNVDFLDITNIIALAIHGKCPEFLSGRIVQRKIAITSNLRKKGFKLLCGHDFETKYKVPTGHVWQLWSRDTFVG
jgi:FkbM family methyltransferase